MARNTSLYFACTMALLLPACSGNTIDGGMDIGADAHVVVFDGAVSDDGVDPDGGDGGPADAAILDGEVDDDGGTSAADGGTTTTDGGSLPEDGGTTTTDGGSLPEDGGTTTTDGGVALCPAGTHDTSPPASTSRICTACSVGQFCAGGSATPQSCVLGLTFDHDADSATACWPVAASCVAGTRQTQAATLTLDRACGLCFAGEYCAGGTAPSVACVVGTTYDHDRNSGTPCVAVAACEAGFEQTTAPTVTSNRACTACSAGEYCAGGTATSVACVVGTTYDHDSDAATACVPATAACGAGFEQTTAPTVTSNRACTACAAGTYCAGGTASPVACVVGTTYDNDSSAATACVSVTAVCRAGFQQTTAPTALVNRVCTSCAAGEYCAGGTASPVACVVGTTYDSDSNAATACVPVTAACGAGFEQTAAPTVTSNRTCTPCAAGTYCAGGTAAPVACVVGTTYDNDSNAATPCVAVAAACAPGSYQSTVPTLTTNRVCAACSVGDYCAGGTAPRRSCVTGTWDHDASPTTVCIAHADCPLDRYLTAVGTATTDRTCVPCPSGSAVLSQNATRCDHWLGGAAFRQVVTQGNLTCGLRADNSKPVCWGQYGTSDPREPDIALASLGIRGPAPCGLRASDATPICWGGYPAVAAPSVPMTEVSGSNGFACGIRADNAALMCWGTVPSFMQPTIGVRYSKISMGGGNVCAVREVDGSAQCWGNMIAPAGLSIEEVEVSSGYACGLRRADGRAQCWNHLGSTVGGEPVESLSHITVMDGYSAACGLVAGSGELRCWGGEPYGVLSAAPVGVRFSSISLGKVACGIRLDTDRVQCWGDDNNISDAGGYGVAFGAPSGISFKDIGGIDPQGTCPLRDDGTMACWGRSAPSGVFVDVDGDSGDMCAVEAATGSVSCWNYANASLPSVAGSFSDVSVTSFHACAIEEGTRFVRCWFTDSTYRDVGNIVSLTPSDLAVDQVDIGSQYACAIRTSDGELQCWGAVLPNVPTNVSFTSIDVAEGSTDGCGIRADNGATQCWGSLVAPVGTLFDEVSVTGNTACGVRSIDGRIVCFGLTNYLPIPPPMTFSDVDISGNTVCGLEEGTGRLICWGLANINPHAP